MDPKGHFKEPFLYVETKGVEEEKRQLYFTFVEKCFDHLLQQSDEYILATVKRNGSLVSFFFSHLLSPHRSYDLPLDRPDGERERSPFDKHIFNLYIKLVRIYLNKDRRETSTIKSTLIKIHVFMDIIMMFHRSKRKKKEIKNLLNEAYRVNRINFLNMSKYISFLYEEVKTLKEEIERHAHNRGNLQNLLFKINEFAVALFCFVKFFHPFNYFDRMENKQTKDLILLRLIFYRGVDVGSFSLSTSAPEILKGGEGSGGSSFIHLLVRTYFEMIHHLYEDTLKEAARKDLLYLRHLFARTLTMMVKYLLLHGNEKNKLLVVSILIDMLKQTSEEMNLLYFLRNDMHMCRWNFLQKFVLKDQLDVDFYFYLNGFLRVNSKREVAKMSEKKYRNEIERLVEITGLKDVGVVLKVLQRNNFDFCKAVEEALARGEQLGGSSDGGSSDGGSSGGGSSGGGSGDGKSGDDQSSDGGSSDGVRSDDRSSDGGSGDDRRSLVHPVERAKPRAAAKHRQRNILDVLRERTRMEKPHRRRSSKSRYTNDGLGEENKNKIFDLLERSSSADGLPGDGSLENYQNDVLPCTSYRKNYRTKRYYMKKTANKGKSHRRQYDKKMSRGML
ncbi:hypothetical protein PVNG_01161 [Plasmodium vivax North Korean]|uniref:Uncharacterized protein n=1 Tax=Plasmodium vivax North Korean TaxID=1035514 RepID=A0A0J9TQ44_PLAVI|nr:hypothetical protein PVNG_01161 [Plasmodium vivax North Korean]